MIRFQYGSKGKYKAWWQIGLEINLIGMLFLNVKDVFRDNGGDRYR